MIDLDDLERDMAITAPGIGDPFVVVNRYMVERVLKRLRRLEQVRDAARAYVDRIEAEAASVEPWNAPELDGGIARALAALDSKDG